MIAKQLSDLLAELCRGSDVTPDTPLEMDRRFETLRSYGQLPRGRENRSHSLSNEQIVAALLGLVTTKPDWAGHVSIILAKLKPVEIDNETFGAAADLTAALSYVLADRSARDSIVAVRLSVAEAGTNSNGLAVITFERDGARHRLMFVRDEAVSLFKPGANRNVDTERRNAPISRELIFNQRFFQRLTQEIDRARAHPLPPSEDSAEYDREDAKRARELRLGVTRSSRFLNIGVDNQVTWPRDETLIQFDRYRLVMMPKTQHHCNRSISICRPIG